MITHVECAFDGACAANGQPNALAAWAYKIWTPKGNSEGSGPVEGAQTNQRAEVSALLHLLKALQRASGRGKLAPNCEIIIEGDSAYAIKGYTEWLLNWVARGWRNSQKKAVENRDLWEQIWELKGDDAIAELNIRFIQVAGHSGYAHNEEVDALATAMVQKLRAAG